MDHIATQNSLSKGADHVPPFTIFDCTQQLIQQGTGAICDRTITHDDERHTKQRVFRYDVSPELAKLSWLRPAGELLLAAAARLDPCASLRIVDGTVELALDAKYAEFPVQELTGQIDYRLKPAMQRSFDKDREGNYILRQSRDLGSTFNVANLLASITSQDLREYSYLRLPEGVEVEDETGSHRGVVSQALYIKYFLKLSDHDKIVELARFSMDHVKIPPELTKFVAAALDVESHGKHQIN